MRSTGALTVFVLIGGLTVAVGAGVGLDAVERAASGQSMDRRTALAGAAVAAETRRYVDAVRAVAAATGSQQALTAAEFAAITAPLTQLRLPGATDVRFVVPAADNQVAAVQQQWRERGAGNLVLRPAGQVREHALVVLRRDLDGRGASSLGLDLMQRPEPARALVEARRVFNVAVSDTYQLIGDENVTTGERRPSVLLTAPVYQVAPDGKGQGAFLGWVAMVLGGEEFIGGTLTEVSQGYLDASLYAVASDGREVPVASVEHGGAAGTGLRREAVIPVAQQRWVLRTEARRGLMPAGSTYLDEVAIAGLTGLTILLAALVFALGTSRNRAEAKVAEATAALRTKQEYVNALVDTMDVILVAADDRGRFTLVNRHAHELHGFGTGIDDNEWATTALTQFYETDGVTPLPPDRLPLQRTFAEGEVHDVEFIVARPGMPPRWLSAHGRHLRAADGTSLGAVTAAHDITRLRESECALRRVHTDLAAANIELERSNEELSAFAGLVSHDLKSPLASVAGYVDLMRGLAEDGTMPAEARPFLDRISNGVQRMRTLIDDLLAFATARNAAPDIAAVDLNTLADDVVAMNTDRLRLRGGPDQLFPDVYVAALPAVAADPMMVRQLMDNLIGNALKYVQPGRAARVDVTAEPGRPGWIRVIVADRGIGIPAGHHAAIFDSFHRAHRTSAYPGTGLGLAICDRIVTRHGGEIGARDNPGGGTQIWFTLPEAGRPTAKAMPPTAVRAEVTAGR
jgi:signal transduction histidine kinase